MDIGRLVALHEMAKEDGSRYAKRRLLASGILAEEGRHFVGIVGPRGAGKTILLKQLASENQDCFYLSVDTLNAESDLLLLIKKLSEQLKLHTFLLDEVHFLRSFSGLLKQIYDFTDVKVIFTSSVALAMHASVHDLSKRARLLNLPYFSFREYLHVARDVSLPRLDIGALAQREWTADHLRAGRHFREYLTGGLLPFTMQDPSPMPLLENIIEKIIAKDIPSTANLMVNELDSIRRLLRFVGHSSVDGINYSSLSRNLGITKHKAEQYVTCLEKAFVLHQVFPRGANVLREPKILMAPPCRLLYGDIAERIGGVREDFFAEAMGQAGLEFHYLKSTRGAKTPDYLIECPAGEFLLEIGGKGKGRSQFKGYHADHKIVLADTDLPDDIRIPLFLVGFLA